MTLPSFEQALKQTVVLGLLLLCAVTLALQPAFAYRVAENTGAIPTPASYSTGTTASNTKTIAGLTNLTATLSINSGTYQSSATGCGFWGGWSLYCSL